MKKIIFTIFLLLGFLSFLAINKTTAQTFGASVLFPYQGGTGLGTAGAGDVGKYLKVSGNSPFTYSFDTPAGGTGSSLNATSTEPLMASWFVATSTTATSTFPRLTSTGMATDWLCLGGDCQTGWPSGSVSGGTAGMLTAWIDATTLTATSAPTAAYYIATSTTATSTFAGGLNVAGTSGLTVLQNGKVGIGTSLPATDFAVQGQSYFDGNVGIGANDTSTQFVVSAKSAASTMEKIAKFGVSDAANSYISIQNSSAVNGNFLPTFLGYNGNDNRYGMKYFGMVADGLYSGQYYPAMVFEGVRRDGTTPLSVVPIVSFTSEHLAKLTTWYDGRTKIGGTDDLDVAGGGVTRPTTMLDVVGVGSHDLMSLIDETDVRMIVKETGNVGIGTTTPAMKLSVQGDALADSWNVYSDIYVGDAISELKKIQPENVDTVGFTSIDHATLPEGVVHNIAMTHFENFYEPIYYSINKEVIDEFGEKETVVSNIIEYKNIKTGKIISEDTYNKLPQELKGTDIVDYILPTMDISALTQMNTRAIVQLAEENLQQQAEIIALKIRIDKLDGLGIEPVEVDAKGNLISTELWVGFGVIITGILGIWIAKRKEILK